MPSDPVRGALLGPDLPLVPQGQQHHGLVRDRLLPLHPDGDVLVRALPDVRPVPHPHRADHLHDWLSRRRSAEQCHRGYAGFLTGECGEETQVRWLSMGGGELCTVPTYRPLGCPKSHDRAGIANGL